MRLNIGCGRDVREGWVNVDVNEFDTWSFAYDARHPGAMPLDHDGPFLVRKDVLPFVDDSCDGAVANHVLQMITYPNVVPWLSEVRRVLKPGAVLRLLVPDLIGAFLARKMHEPAWFPIADELEQSLDGKLCLYLSQSGSTRSLFTPEWLSELCTRAGFERAHVMRDTWGPIMSGSYGPDWMTDLDSRIDESVIVEAVK